MLVDDPSDAATEIRQGRPFLGHDLRSKKETFNQRPEAYREYLNFILRALFCSEDPVRGRQILEDSD